MTDVGTSKTTARVLDASNLQALFDLLVNEGYELRAPTVRDGAIVYAPIGDVEQLPRHATSTQRPGYYRLEDSNAEFRPTFANGPAATGLKPWLHVSRETLVTLRRKGDAIERPITLPQASPGAWAFIGARACDLAAVAVQDRVLRQQDPAYAGRRSRALFVAVSCLDAVDSCFCASMATGPRVTQLFDLCLTELPPGREPTAESSEAGERGDESNTPRFVVEAGSDAGRKILDRLPTRPATLEETRAPDLIAERVAASQTRRLDTDRIRERLQENPEHSRFDDVAARCLSCTNCTLVCPTCFCSTVEDHASVDESEVERVRRWDSCFSADFSFMHGGVVRDSTRSRYRQWITHKLSTWHDQFGESGCVGCGRCITWCPVGIDITEEANAIRDPARTEES